MKVIYFGELSENNRVIRDVCNEMGVALEFSKDLNVLDVDVIIPDLSYVKKICLLMILLNFLTRIIMAG